jgi:hypothetical protein
MTSPMDIDRRTARGISVVAAVTALAPFVVQTATLVLTHSSAWTLAVGLLLALAFAFAALAFQARQTGGWNRIGAGSAAGIVLAVLTYHVIAYPVAHILDAMFFAGSGQ